MNKTPSDTVVRLPETSRWPLVPAILSLAVLSIGLIAMIPEVTAAELGVDQWLSFHHIAWFNAVALFIEGIFGPTGAVLILVSAFFITWIIRRSPIPAFLLVSTTAAGWVFSLVFKYLLGRPRPLPSSLANPLSPEMDPYSFPSGHVCFVMALVLAIYFLNSKASWSRAFLTIGMLIVIFVAFTRVYVGVHYPIDVLAAIPTAVAGTTLWTGTWNRVAPRLRFIQRLDHPRS